MLSPFLVGRCRLKYYKALVPSCEEMRIKWADSWNGGVKTVFTFIDQLPQNTVDGVAWTVNKVYLYPIKIVIARIVCDLREGG